MTAHHQDFNFIWLFIAVFGAIVLVSFWLDKKRREALSRVAATLGLKFMACSDGAFLGQMAAFNLGNQGYGRVARNLMEGEYQNAAITVFDYFYTTGSGRSQAQHRQTVLMFSLGNQARCPEFSVRPENFLDKVATAFGHVDINFEHDEAFSKAYRLHGKDEAAVRLLFDDSVRDFLVRNPNLCVEASGSSMILYRKGICVAPEGLRSFLDRSMELLTRLAANATA